MDTPNRYYNPRLGVWMTPDPAGMGAADTSDPQSMNRYAYVENDPINNSDPSGLCIEGFCTPDDPNVIPATGCFFLGCFGNLPEGEIFRPNGEVIEWGVPTNVFGILPGENSINFPLGNPLDLLPLPLGCAAGAALGGITGGMSSCTPQQGCDFGSCGNNFSAAPIPFPWPTVGGLGWTDILGPIGWLILERGDSTAENPLAKKIQTECRPGKISSEPSTRWPSGTSYQQVYYCEAFSPNMTEVWTIHWVLDKNGQPVHKPHPRPGFPKPGLDE